MGAVAAGGHRRARSRRHARGRGAVQHPHQAEVGAEHEQGERRGGARTTDQPMAVGPEHGDMIGFRGARPCSGAVKFPGAAGLRARRRAPRWRESTGGTAGEGVYSPAGRPRPPEAWPTRSDRSPPSFGGVMTARPLIPLLAIALVALGVAATTPQADDATYIGANKCRMCHMPYFKAWSATKHAHAMAA